VICSLTHLACLKTCGGPHGDRCPVAPPHDSAAALASFADAGIRAVYTRQALSADGARTLALAQLAESGAVSTGLTAAWVVPLGFPVPKPPPPPPSRPIVISHVTPIRYALDNNVPLVERVFRGQVVFTLKDGRQMDFGFGRQQVPADLAEDHWLKARMIPPGYTTPLIPPKPSRYVPTPDPTPSLERVVGVSELIGWRIWWINPDLSLKSYSRDTIWHPGKPMYGLPQDDGVAGVWAFKERRRATRKAAENRRDHGGYAWGTVALWGEVIEHEYGWRGEYARIVSLDGVVLPWPDKPTKAAIRKPHRMLTSLRRKYGVAGFAKINMAHYVEIAEKDVKA
jgi:hypothetical protein